MQSGVKSLHNKINNHFDLANGFAGKSLASLLDALLFLRAELDVSARADPLGVAAVSFCFLAVEVSLEDRAGLMTSFEETEFSES